MASIGSATSASSILAMSQASRQAKAETATMATAIGMLDTLLQMMASTQGGPTASGTGGQLDTIV